MKTAIREIKITIAETLKAHTQFFDDPFEKNYVGIECNFYGGAYLFNWERALR